MSKPDRSPDQQAIFDTAEKIAEAFIDTYHQRDGSFAELKAEYEAQGRGSLDVGPYENSMRAALGVMGALGIYEGGEGEEWLTRSKS